MRELPIPFSAPMVPPALDGRKTKTRRVVRPQPVVDRVEWAKILPGAVGWVINANGTWRYDGQREGQRFAFCGPYRCPYGQPRDRLWVREAWRSLDYLDNLSGSAMAEACLAAGYKRPWAPIEYIADGARVNWEHTGTPPHSAPPQPGRYRHARFMPHWASRITLEITGVRVERLQEISEADAIAEGIIRDRDGWRGAPDLPWFASPIAAFRSLWESINGVGSWDDNPWVWVVEFRRVEKAHG